MKNLTDLLPIKNPMTYVPDRLYFYDNIVEHLVRDVIAIMDNGIPIDIEKVKVLDKELTEIIKEESTKLNNLDLIKKFITKVDNDKRVYKAETIAEKEKGIAEFLQEFNYKTIHVNYLVDEIVKDLIKKGKIESDVKRTKGSNWTKSDMKYVYEVTNSPYLLLVLNKDFDNPLLERYKTTAMYKLAEDKKEIDDIKRKARIEKLKDKEFYEKFSHSSALQVRELFTKYLGIESTEKTKKNEDSWNKKALEHLLEVVETKIAVMEVNSEISCQHKENG